MPSVHFDLLNMIDLKSCLILHWFLITKCLSYYDDTQIETNVGSIIGLKATDGEYYMFLGIPYAKVDKKNAFGASVPYPPFEEVYEAYDDSIVCPQINQQNLSVIGDLDCLRLNVFVPASIYSSNLLVPSHPVMIWVYGGGFQYGHAGRSLYGPNHLVQHDVIVVTFNYRTGPYGFMCLDLPEVSGNQGLKDQYLAFKWVKENIQAFGGDPYQITLFGEGAGAHSIDLHLISHKEILYSKIILQSGSSQAATVLYKPDKLAPLKMTNYIGYHTNHTRDAMLYLTKVDAKQVITAANNLNIQFKPCVETLFDGVEPFLAASWVNARVPKIKNIPVIMGFNKVELARSIFPKSFEYFRNLTIVSDTLRKIFDYTDQDLVEASDLIYHYYFGDEEMNEKLKWQVIHFSSDFTYIHPVHRTMRRYLDNGAGDIYFYMFSYVGGRNAIITTIYENDPNDNRLCCASHADELGYIFTNMNQPELSTADQTVLDRITKLWTNFAKHGEPTPEVSEVLPTKWKPVTPNAYYYLNMDVDFILQKRPLHDRMAFWDLFYRYNKKLQSDYEED